MDKPGGATALRSIRVGEVEADRRLEAGLCHQCAPLGAVRPGADPVKSARCIVGGFMAEDLHQERVLAEVRVEGDDAAHGIAAPECTAHARVETDGERLGEIWNSPQISPRNQESVHTGYRRCLPLEHETNRSRRGLPSLLLSWMECPRQGLPLLDSLVGGHRPTLPKHIAPHEVSSQVPRSRTRRDQGGRGPVLEVPASLGCGGQRVDGRAEPAVGVRAGAELSQGQVPAKQVVHRAAPPIEEHSEPR